MHRRGRVQVGNRVGLSVAMQLPEIDIIFTAMKPFIESLRELKKV